MCTGFWWGIVSERDHLVVPDFYENNTRIILILLQEVEREAWTGLWWLWMGSGCENFRMQ